MLALSALAQLIAGLLLAASPVGAGDADLVKVPLDSPIYDKPSNQKTKRPQMLKGGAKVILMRMRIDDWCQVAPADVPIPGGPGWIWCGIDKDGKDYRLKPVAADAPKD
jgi:hypothetical protein